jgi:hypothetical protein
MIQNRKKPERRWEGGKEITGLTPYNAVDATGQNPASFQTLTT